jgi:hypothetical protein
MKILWVRLECGFGLDVSLSQGHPPEKQHGLCGVVALPAKPTNPARRGRQWLAGNPRCDTPPRSPRFAIDDSADQRDQDNGFRALGIDSPSTHHSSQDQFNSRSRLISQSYISEMAARNQKSVFIHGSIPCKKTHHSLHLLNQPIVLVLNISEVLHSHNCLNPTKPRTHVPPKSRTWL